MDERKRSMAISLYEDRTRSVADICQVLRISRATFYNYIRNRPSE
jgi:predicted transcriptional regulator YheO